MKAGKGAFIAVECVLGAVCILLIALMLTGKSEQKPRVSVVIENSGDSSWASLRYGMMEAAEDYDVDLTIANTDIFFDAEDMNSEMQQEMADGARTLIVWPMVDDHTKQYLDEASGRVQVITIGSDADSDLPHVGADDYALGEKLAQKILSDFDGSLQGKTMGILIDNAADSEQTERQKGLKAGLAKSGVKYAWTLNREELAQNDQDTEDLLEDDHYAADVIVALSDRDFQEAGNTAKKGELHGAVLYGFGSSTAAVSFVDNGEAAAVLVPDQFRMGYEAVHMAAESLESGRIRNVTVTGKILDRDVIFEPKNQQILYALSRE